MDRRRDREDGALRIRTIRRSTRHFWKGVDRLPRKEAISIKLDDDVLAFFRKQGRGYQTRINAVLRRYMQAQRKAG